ncbi:MAG TPA: chemotaxis-specific protein-glutamate methyltransferase CheB [Roseiflexaceae bacterium]|nr:chemotaxis-specific protein-glutamate methyltransferase CheB [Roseiflexaceae bacterium]
MSQPIRVLVVDDSALMRRMIITMLEQDPAIRVVGQAANGREAIAKVEELQPDVVTMDVRMPVMDGLATTEHLMAYRPTPILVLTASLASHEVDITFKMLGAGALEVVEKPSTADVIALDRAARDLIRRVKVLSRVKVVTHLRGRRKQTETDETLPRSHVQPLPRSHVQAFQCSNTPVAFPVIVIGASTGGPRVIHQILAGLPRGLEAAVVVVQHIAEGFSPGMVEWLATASPLPVALAEEGCLIRPRQVLVAPDQRDLLITAAGRAHLSESPLLIQRPSVDITMQAAAEVYGARTIGVVLTGMGRDGAYGLQAIRRCGGRTLAQDEASCAIYGMPRAAVTIGAVEEILPPAQIASRLVELVAAQYAVRI